MTFIEQRYQCLLSTDTINVRHKHKYTNTFRFFATDEIYCRALPLTLYPCVTDSFATLKCHRTNGMETQKTRRNCIKVRQQVSNVE